MGLEAKIMARVKDNVASVDEKVGFGQVLQGTKAPFITFRESMPGIDYTHDGRSGLENPIYEFHIWAKDYVTARTILIELLNVFDAWHSDGVSKVFLVDGGGDMIDPDTGEYHTIVNFKFYYEG